MDQYPQPWRHKSQNNKKKKPKADYYYFTYYDKNGIRRNKSTKKISKFEARQFIEKFINDSKNLKNPTLKDYCAPYYIWETCPIVRNRINENKSIGQEHVINSRRLLEKYVLEDEIADIKINDLTRGDLVIFRDKIKKKFTVSITNNVMKMLKAILNNAFYEEIIDRNICAGIGNIQKNDVKVDIFTYEETAKLFLPVNNYFMHDTARIAFLVALEAGLRRSEILALSIRDIDFTNKIIRVTRAWKCWSKRMLDLPKWGKIREVPISVLLEEELKQYIAQNEKSLTEFLICNKKRNLCHPVHGRPGLIRL